MEFAAHITTSLTGRRRDAVPPSRVPATDRAAIDLAAVGPAVVDPAALCWWCGLEVTAGWPADHPAAPLVVASTRPGGVEGTWPEHRFCADPAHRGFDVDDPDASLSVRRASLAFAMRLATADDLVRARQWQRFRRGGDPGRTTVAHLRSLLRLGVRPGAADVVAVLGGPVTRRLYLARVRRWSRRAAKAAGRS